MTYDYFATSTNPKVKGSWNLHELLPKGMAFFVCLSSVGGVMGSPGQLNYVVGNNFKDALAHYRVAHAKKAVTLDLGMMEAEGVLARNESLQGTLRRAGFFLEVSRAEFLARLDRFCDPSLPIQTSGACPVATGIQLPRVIQSRGVGLPLWMHRPLFRVLHQVNDADETGENSADANAGPNYPAMFERSESVYDATAQVVQLLVEKMSRILGMQADDMDVVHAPHSYGIDSLVAVEIRNRFDKEVRAEIPLFDLLGNKSISSICQMAITKSQYNVKGWTMEAIP